MRNVVYILGAGFSRPLGIPVMSEFYEASRDLRIRNGKEYGYFDRVFEDVLSLSHTKNYYDADLRNIEEILSLFETMALNREDAPEFRERFLNYVRDVIKSSMARMDGKTLTTAAFWQSLYPGKWPLYCTFVNSMLGLRHNEVEHKRVNTDYCTGIQTRYDIVTLNVDRVLETAVDFVNERYPASGPVGFNGTNNRPVGLHKLHGCISSDIVPPTWNKTILSEDVKNAWKGALKALSEANHIRVIGYSLPDSDSYIRYLFKAAGTKAVDLRSIDIMCLDPDGSVKSRYAQFIRHHRCRFYNVRTEQYLGRLLDATTRGLGNDAQTIAYDKLEEAHRAFVEAEAENCTYLKPPH